MKVLINLRNTIVLLSVLLLYSYYPLFDVKVMSAGKSMNKLQATIKWPIFTRSFTLWPI